jgi:hypothetical protein
VEGVSLISVIWNNHFTEKVRPAPVTPVPAVKTDLNSLDVDLDVVIWLGHSSYFMQLGGKRILIDPVFSDHAAPFSFLNKIFKETDVYTAADMPEIDYCPPLGGLKPPALAGSFSAVLVQVETWTTISTARIVFFRFTCTWFG